MLTYNGNDCGPEGEIGNFVGSEVFFKLIQLELAYLREMDEWLRLEEEARQTDEVLARLEEEIAKFLEIDT